MGAGDTPLISVRDLTVRFGSFTAIDEVSFDLHDGETLAIVGESGSGKSVTALSIMGLVDIATRATVDAGNIFFRMPDGDVIDLLGLPEPQKRQIRGNHISMIFQEPLTSLNPVYTVGNQVAEAVMAHQAVGQAEAKERTLEMFRLVRIPEAGRRVQEYPHQMSGGMRQRVMIAMALSCNPSVLIADEPTTALDVTIQSQILGLMRNLREETGAAVIIITHDMSVVAEVADRVLVMKSSRTVESGTVLDVFENPQEPYTKALLAAVPRLGSMTGRREPARFDLVHEEMLHDT